MLPAILSEFPINFSGISAPNFFGHPDKLRYATKIISVCPGDGRVVAYRRRRLLPQKLAEPRGHALLLNHTAHSYHWGCYATSMAIYLSLIEQGFSVQTYDVDATHHNFVSAAPTTIDEIDGPSFQDALLQSNPMLVRDIAASDIIVVNGEGTLHGFANGPRSLLSVMRLAKKRFEKSIFLINHSCYPSDTLEPAAESIDTFYRGCVSACTHIVVREPVSRDIYARLGVFSSEAFDLLPLYLERYTRLTRSAPSYLLVGTSAPWGHPEVRYLANSLQALRSQLPQSPIAFLSGGKVPPIMDEPHFATLRSIIPNIAYLKPNSIAEWLDLIAAAPLIITGRFHHLVAAAALQIPAVAMPSNTPKNTGLCLALGWATPILPTADDFSDRLAHRIKAPSETTERQSKGIAQLGQKNLVFSA